MSNLEETCEICEQPDFVIYVCPVCYKRVCRRCWAKTLCVECLKKRDEDDSLVVNSVR